MGEFGGDFFDPKPRAFSRAANPGAGFRGCSVVTLTAEEMGFAGFAVFAVFVDANFETRD
jgi:hypothetical protein